MNNKLNQIKEYFQSMEMYEGKWVVCVQYKPHWSGYSSDDGKIKCVPDEKVQDVWWYCATTQKIEPDDIFELITETVQTNIDARRKAELLKLKGNELKALFMDAKNSFQKLQTLKFVFDDENTGAQTKVTKKPSIKKARTMSKKDILKQATNVAEEEMMEQKPIEEKIPMPTPLSSNKVIDKEEPMEYTEPYGEPIKEEVVINATDMSDEEINDLRG